ncbi:hypothetical protein BX589_104134 [Paraburkholderia fungorum]|jgi:hypothetical protein|nr:hypothetical protein BX589_104134 [Paraburkholderia fungorum]
MRARQEGARSGPGAKLPAGAGGPRVKRAGVVRVLHGYEPSRPAAMFTHKPSTATLK